MKRNSTKAIVKCVFSVVALMLLQITNAQIVHTDIKDITYTCNKKCGGNCYVYDCIKTYALDLNKDGATDFNIGTYIQVRNYDGGNGYCHCYETFYNSVDIDALNDNSVVHGPLGSALTAGSNISSSSEWPTGGLRLKSVSQECDLSYYGAGQCVIRHGGDWPNSSDRYLGLKIILNGQTHYDWARLSVLVDNKIASFKIMDYAYESSPDRAIIAGDKGESVVAKPPTPSSSEEQPGSEKLLITPNPVSSSTTISFFLSKKEKVSIHLFDMTGRLAQVIAFKKFDEGSHEIKLDSKNLSAGIYLLKMQTPEMMQTKKIVVVK